MLERQIGMVQTRRQSSANSGRITGCGEPTCPHDVLKGEVMPPLSQILKRAFLAAGLDVQWARRNGHSSQRPIPLLHHRIELLFDVGANSGQFAAAARQHGYSGKIVSFEPLPDAHDRLVDCARNDPTWTIHDRCALGAQAGQVEINVAANSYSSSILPMLSRHIDAAPSSSYIGKCSTPLITLDSIFPTYRSSSERTYLKIDTQGYERHVLDGASASLENVLVVELELSTVKLYEGQDLYDYFVDFFGKRGFSLWSIEPAFVDRRTGQMLQIDAVFSRAI